MSNGGHNNLRLDLKVRPISNKIFSIASEPEIIYIFNQEKQEFGHCSRDLEAEKSHAYSILQMLGLEPNAEYQWTLSKPTNIFRLLSLLKNNVHCLMAKWGVWAKLKILKILLREVGGPKMGISLIGWPK